MNYFKRKRIAIMRLVEGVKGFVRTISGVPPITLPDCVDEDSLISYSISGNSVQIGEPTPENPIEVESVGDYDEAIGKYKIPILCGQSLDYVKFKKGYFINSSGVEAASGGYKCTEDYIPVLPNVTYRMVCEGTANTISAQYSLTIPFYNDNKEFLSRISLGAVNVSPKIREFTTPNECYYIRFSLPNAYDYDVSLYNLDNATNIYLDEPLAQGETIKNPVKLPTIKGTTIYSTDTQVQPSNMSANYYSTSKGE